MSKRDWKILLEYILEAVDKIENYTKNLTRDDFIKNSMVVDAVVRNFEIIGEASKNVPAEVQKKLHHIPWKKLCGIRNRIVHEYFGVDLNIIWFIIENELFQLKQTVLKGLKNKGNL
jgi:uncharacterized protein with HEPN domain